MKLLILKTEIRNSITQSRAERILIFEDLIFDWTIDHEDTDRVLRIEAFKELNEIKLIEKLNKEGIICSEL